MGYFLLLSCGYEGIVSRKKSTGLGKMVKKTRYKKVHKDTQYLVFSPPIIPSNTTGIYYNIYQRHTGKYSKGY